MLVMLFACGVWLMLKPVGRCMFFSSSYARAQAASLPQDGVCAASQGLPALLPCAVAPVCPF